MAQKVIITCAVTGAIHTPSMSPYLPVTPEEIADAAIGAAEAGAAGAPLHPPDPRHRDPPPAPPPPPPGPRNREPPPDPRPLPPFPPENQGRRQRGPQSPPGGRADDGRG